MIAVVTLWILTILSVFSVTVGTNVRSELEAGRHEIMKLKSRELAASGIATARQVLDSDATPAVDHLLEPWASGRDRFRDVTMGDGWFNVSYANVPDPSIELDFTYGARDEEGKININYASRQILARLPGLTGEIADCILDWRDPDELTRPEGAEDNYYEREKLPYTCANRPFVCLEELMMVKGVDAGVYAAIEPFVTVYGDSLVNVSTAPHPVLTALGIPERLIEKIVSFRQSPGAFANLGDDDRPLVDQFIDRVGDHAALRPDEQVMLKALFTSGTLKMNSSVFRIRAEGLVPVGEVRDREGDIVSVTIEVVYQRGGQAETAGTGGYLYWRED